MKALSDRASRLLDCSRCGVGWHGRRTEFVILRLTRKTTALAGENPAEWAGSRKPGSLGAVNGPPPDGRGAAADPRGQARRGGAGGRRGGVETPAAGTPHLVKPRALGVPVTALLE